MENKKKKLGEKGEGGERARTDNTIDDTAQQRAKSDLPFTEPTLAVCPPVDSWHMLAVAHGLGMIYTYMYL